MRRPFLLPVLLGLSLLGFQLYRSFLVLPAFRSFALTVVSLFLEGLPFLLLGSVAAALVRSFLPADLLPRLERRVGLVGLPVVALTGLVAPVCECAIVPTVRSLRDRGLSLPYAITVLTSVPIVNPVVIASTVAAFPGRGSLVVARITGGYIVAVCTGLVFALPIVRKAVARRTAAERHRAEDRHHTHDRRHDHEHDHSIDTAPVKTSPRERIVGVIEDMVHEFVEVSRYFMTGVLLASLVQVLIPPERFALIGSRELLAILLMIAMAWVLSVCSEADAFIGKAFLPMLPASAVLAFLVFGPMLDLKNTIMLRRMLAPRQIAWLSATLVVMVSGYSWITGTLWQ